MRHAEQTVTLYNYALDGATGYDACTRHIIAGVSVFGKTEVRVDKDGLHAADLYTIRVPESCGAFNFRPGDVIVLGAAKDENPRPAELKAKYHAVTVVGCTDNRGKREGHWKVVCK